MNPEVYKRHIEFQSNHWWFQARKEIIGKIIKKYTKNKINILDYGSGSGVNIEMLSKYGFVYIYEPHRETNLFLKKKYKNKKKFKVLNSLNNKKFDLIVMADVLEHIKYDKKQVKKLKKNYSGGSELKGKTLGVVGFGRIGQEVAKIGLGIGMNIIFYDLHNKEANIKIDFFDGSSKEFVLKSSSFEELLNKSDFISLHVPAQKDYIIGEKEFSKMKDGSGIINAARGGVIDEESLIKHIENKKIAFAALDTFENEPTPSIKILMNQNISLTPHIGAATNEAQKRIGIELADQIINIYKL